MFGRAEFEDSVVNQNRTLGLWRELVQHELRMQLGIGPLAPQQVASSKWRNIPARPWRLRHHLRLWSTIYGPTARLVAINNTPSTNTTLDTALRVTQKVQSRNSSSKSTPCVARHRSLLIRNRSQPFNLLHMPCQDVLSFGSHLEL